MAPTSRSARARAGAMALLSMYGGSTTSILVNVPGEAASAVTAIDGYQAEPRVLRPGDPVRIAARRRHRVEWTDAAEPTVWLALHYSAR